VDKGKCRLPVMKRHKLYCERISQGIFKCKPILGLTMN
jgi:hypothetical protein